MKIKKLIAAAMSAILLLGFNYICPFETTAASNVLPTPYNNLNSGLI